MRVLTRCVRPLLFAGALVATDSAAPGVCLRFSPLRCAPPRYAPATLPGAARPRRGRPGRTARGPRRRAARPRRPFVWLPCALAGPGTRFRARAAAAASRHGTRWFALDRALQAPARPPRAARVLRLSRHLLCLHTVSSLEEAFFCRRAPAGALDSVIPPPALPRAPAHDARGARGARGRAVLRARAARAAGCSRAPVCVAPAAGPGRQPRGACALGAPTSACP